MPKKKEEIKKYDADDTVREVKKKNKELAEKKKQREDEVFKEFIEKQKNYRISFKRRILKQEEMKEMARQIRINENTNHGKPEMMWYGMPMPMPILKATYNLGIEAYQEIIKSEQDTKKELIDKYGLTEKQLEMILYGKYVKKIPKRGKV